MRRPLPKLRPAREQLHQSTKPLAGQRNLLGAPGHQVQPVAQPRQRLLDEDIVGGVVQALPGVLGAFGI